MISLRTAQKSAAVFRLCALLCSFAASYFLASVCQAQLLHLPPRPDAAPTGSQFVSRVASLSLSEREQDVYKQVVSGNVPDFLRRLCPVQVTNVFEKITNTATFFVAPDYLAIGSDPDYVLMPISPGTAQRIADELNCSLPTRKMVDTIYASAEVKLEPSPIPPSAAMTTVNVFSNHNALVRAQRAEQLARHPLGALTAGDKKDVVISARLASSPGKIAIYGWHKTNGAPIQPLYLGHTSAWVDYSQCSRLVSQVVLVNGTSNTVAGVLSNPALAGLLSDEGVVLFPRYPTQPLASSLPDAPHQFSGASNAVAPENAAEPQWTSMSSFGEKVTWLNLEPGVRVQINAPAHKTAATNKTLLVFYAVPNGNTIQQTVGRQIKPGEDWHFSIQHIGAQTRFLRERLADREIVIAYLENSLKSWPAWRKQNGDQLIPGLLKRIQLLANCPGGEVALAGHSGGGSLIFGYLNAIEAIPDSVSRLAFLDSNYAYDRAAHCDKLVRWLKASDQHSLCVLAYNDAVALLNGKSFVSAAGGTWGKSHEMQRDLGKYLQFTCRTNAELQTCSALSGRVQFLLKENPERKILHTVQVERNGFIHALLTGTPEESKGYEYFGPAAYDRWIQRE